MKASHSKNLNWQNRLARTVVVFGVIVGPHPRLAQAATVDVGNSAALVSAIANCSDGDTIVLTNNITVSAEVAISAKGLTIQGNNYSVCVPVTGLNGSGVTNAAGSGLRLCLYVHHTDAKREWAYDRNSPVGRFDKALDEA
jgi:hypothetical protein